MAGKNKKGSGSNSNPQSPVTHLNEDSNSNAMDIPSESSVASETEPAADDQESEALFADDDESV